MSVSNHRLQNPRLFLLWISILEITGVISLHAQTYFFDNYSTQQGFESKVYAIVQDKNHHVWLGTPTGVSEFDGNNFVTYTQDKGLAEGSVRILFIDNNDALWLGHEGGGITRRNGKVFEKITLLDSVLRSNITSIIQDKDNQLWITTESDGILVIKNPEDPAPFMEFEHYLKGKSLWHQVFGSLSTADGNLYFITNVGIRKYNKTGNSFEIYSPKGLSTYFSISAMFEDSKDNLWFGTYNGGLTKMNPRENTFQEFNTHDGLASNWITSITEDRAGNIWVGHWKNDYNPGGISRIDPSGHTMVFNTSNGLHDDFIWCIREDHEGNILIGTTDQGLEIYKGERFVSFTKQDGLADNLVNAVIEDQMGQIWFGTNQGISVYGGEGKKPSFLHLNQTNKFIPNQISFFKKDGNKNIWIGTPDLGVLVYNTTRKQFISKNEINSYIEPGQAHTMRVEALEVDNNGHLWIGTGEGLVEYDIIKDSYVATYTQGLGLAGNKITALFADSKGNLWIGAGNNKGLTRLHNGVFTIIRSIKDITPTCMTEDNDGKLWIGTDSKGILVLDKDSVKHYLVIDGLLSDRINLLYCDSRNNIYVGTNFGLNKIDQRNKKILAYTKRMGFTGIETKANAWYMDSKGYLWLGTANGAIRCDLNLLALEDTTKPTIRINVLLVKGDTSEMVQGNRFRSNQNDITFKYSSVSLTNPEGISYQVKLEGFDDTWQDQKNENTKVYNKIQPGRYTFKVRAQNGYGEWTETPASYSFRILPPPYRRGYFIITVVCIIMASIIAYIKVRERSLVEEKKNLEKKVHERTQALSVANDELSMRNRDITDSITYAKRIQFAILPPDIPYDNTFILFKPKDIVSGDFYWMNTAGGKEFLAAVDCTGHGVPGAFMSFIGFTSLNKIIIEQGIYKPSAVLNRLNEEVAINLHQKGEAIVNDGMDIALICYSPDNGMLEYAGAFNPLIIVRKGELIEIKADRFAIGRSIGQVKPFTNHEIQLEKGDALYIYSDGYADQFGGPEGKKFKTAALKELLINISEFDADSQQKILESALEDWKGGQEQIDDVLVVGRKF
jgi:ligand-binding sensor domain-containing protein/serine phosphatase RsbU (regulator of sigma subunit)